MIRSGVFSLLLSAAVSAAAPCQLEQQSYRVGTEAIDFYPHYNFTATGKPGYANLVLQQFADYAGLQLEFKPLPVKRLYHEIDRLVDAVYPDHPRWVHYQGTAPERYFSQPVAAAVGTALVRQQRESIDTAQVRSLAIIHGFTPIAWFGIREQYRFRIIEVPDAETALRLLLSDRVDVVDLEYNVARYQLSRLASQQDIAVAVHLPYTLGQYHLSSASNPALIQCFNQFLQQYQSQLRALKVRFGLTDTLPFEP